MKCGNVGITCVHLFQSGDRNRTDRGWNHCRHVYDMDSVAAIGLTSFLLEEYRTRQQFSRDPENGFAIRMMMKLSRDIRYTGLYGMNNLIIHV